MLLAQIRGGANAQVTARKNAVIVERVLVPVAVVAQSWECLEVEAEERVSVEQSRGD